MFGLIILMSAPLVADPTFPETLTVNDTSYVQANSSSIKLLGIIKLTSASLYLGEGHSVEDYPGDIPLALRLRYDRNFKKEQLIGSADEILNDLYTAEQLAEIECEEIGILLGQSFTGYDTALVALDKAICARELDDAPLVQYLSRRAYRDEWLYLPAVSLYPDRQWSALDE